MQLITDTQRAAMADNGRTSRDNGGADPYPVVKLFTPDLDAAWLLREIDPDDPDLAFGLCDMGLWCPELGPVSLREIAAVRGPLGLPVERDLYFRATMSLGDYAAAARAAGRIVS